MAQNNKANSKYASRSTTSNQKYWDVTTGKYSVPQYADMSTINNTYNLTTDRKKYLSQLNAATKKQYNNTRTGLANNQRVQTGEQMAQQNADAAMLARQRAQATATGAARGADAATQLTSMLGANQIGAANQTAMTNSYEQTYLDEKAALAQNKVDARNLTDANKKLLMGHATNRYGVDMDQLGRALSASSTYLGYSAK